MEIKERIQEYLKNKGVTIAEVERMLKWGNGSFSKPKSVSADRAREFLLLFDDLSAEWLMRGEGEMFKSSSQKIGNISHSSAVVNNGNGNSIANNDLSKMIELQQEYISMLKKKDEQIDRLTIVIEKMTNRL